MDLVVRRQSEHLGHQLSDAEKDKDETNNPNYLYACRKWEWDHLRTECRNLGIETFYKTYVQRLQRSFLSIFFIVHTIIGMVHTIILVATQQSKPISPEVYCYLISILIVWVLLIPSFKEDLIKRHPLIPYFASATTIISLVILDITVPLYHSVVTHILPPLRPAYDIYIILTVYIFVPLPENFHTIILGMSTTVCYMIVTTFITYRLDQNILIKSITDFIFLLYVNFFGVYFRFLNEVAIRRAFLDRRDCVEGNLILRMARDQETKLLLSILPAHTAAKLENAIRNTIQRIRFEKRMRRREMNSKSLIDMIPQRRWRGQPINKLYIEHHKIVSVLYADVVNYTQITTQLPVKTLVEVLHELFVKFDQASEEFNVLRIKFLGDCYYCVSGVPEYNPHHAQSCVELGLRMIRDIREVRAQRNKLNIDMRIGIHSGSIMSGVIGACKWQYDIWSKDASIANRLETTGVPGKVHITKQTLDLLDDQYLFEPGTKIAKTDEFLLKNNIETFLISPQYYGDFHYYTPDEVSRRFSVGMKKIMSRAAKRANDSRKPTRNFMQNSMQQYMQIMKQTNDEMARELDKMPIGKFHLSTLFSNRFQNNEDNENEIDFSSNLSTAFLLFKNRNWELKFLKEPDIMLKYSTLMCFAAFIGIFSIQALNNPNGLIYWIINGIIFLILSGFLFIVWFKKAWIMWTPPEDEAPGQLRMPQTIIFRAILKLSDKIFRSAIARFLIYIISILLLVVSAIIHLIECNFPDEIQENLENIKAEHVLRDHPCNSWAVTQCVILALFTNFMFIRVHFLFKLTIGCMIVGFYSWIIFYVFNDIFERSTSINASLSSKAAHLLTVIFASIIFHLVDRQAEYISKIDYNWKQQLHQKQKEARFTKDTIKILVQNILPAHVAEIYMNRHIRDELYYEEYENVAIMFAHIMNYDLECDDLAEKEKNTLSILNRIICEFDEKLLSKTGPLKIEKIKVAGWTYMVACGLNPGRNDSSASYSSNYYVSNQRLSILSNGRRSWNVLKNAPKTPESNPRYDPKTRERKQSSRQSQNVVYVLSEFALELMRILDNFNKDNFQEGCLRIGIAHGKVMAGVVGSCKPLYDVWGNCVNMASRMESTGDPGKIQLTKESAEELQSFGIKCEFRGDTYVKGRGNIPTYYAGINDNLEFIRKTAPVALHHGSS